MRSSFKSFLFSLLCLACLFAFPAAAATSNPTLGADAMLVPLHISGQYTTSTTSVAKFALPFPAKLLSVTATARASGGTSPTLTVDVKEGGTSVLSAPVSITAGTVATATVSDSALADEASMTVDLAITGTNPTWNDITVLLALARK
jgi:hypothetical protein